MVQCEDCGYGDGVHREDCIFNPARRRESAAEFAARVDPGGRLEAAILANRADPSPENHERVLAVMREDVDRFLREQTIDYQRRTR